MKNLSHFCGGGDLWSFWPFFTEEEKSSIEHITWCGNSHKVCIPVFQANSRYRHVKHTVLPDSDALTRRHFLNSTNRFFTLYRWRPYTGLHDLFGERLADVGFDLPAEYIAIQPSTPYNDAACRQRRDMEPRDWQAVLEGLEGTGWHGVVLNSPGGGEVPTHPLVIDLSGRTSYLESVEILKAAQGYWGIDSNLGVIAAKFFPTDRLRIRCPNPWLLQNSYLAYCPHTTTDFIYPHLDADPHPQPEPPEFDPNDVWIRVLYDSLFGSRVHMPGEVVRVSPERAKKLLESGRATYWEGDEWVSR